MVGPKQTRCRAKRSERRRERLTRAKGLVKSLSGEVKRMEKDRFMVVGSVNGKVIYTSKRLRSADQAAWLRNRWERQMARRICECPKRFAV